ncbi:MAG TPA: hypothetical protein VL403_14560 [Candidatus Kryptonia bacterium]|nr:hypothetical protein [Candidatus Kryptonia bacterium]
MAHCSAVAADTKVETPEGSMTIRAVAGQAIAVLTKTDTGRHLFRLMKNVEKAADQEPVLRITLENGLSFRVGLEQILFKHGMVETRAADLAAGITLESAFHFPVGHQYKDARGNGCTSTGAWQVKSVEPAGNAEVYRLNVNQTGTFFLSAGVLCKADGN